MIRVYRNKNNMKFKLGIPVRFDGNIVGKTINENEIMIDNNDDIYRMLTSGQAEINLEVVRKHD